MSRDDSRRPAFAVADPDRTGRRPGTHLLALLDREKNEVATIPYVMGDGACAHHRNRGLALARAGYTITATWKAWQPGILTAGIIPTPDRDAEHRTAPEPSGPAPGAAPRSTVAHITGTTPGRGDDSASILVTAYPDGAFCLHTRARRRRRHEQIDIATESAVDLAGGIINTLAPAQRATVLTGLLRGLTAPAASFGGGGNEDRGRR